MSSSTQSPGWFRSVRRQLLQWYDDHRRELPWRQTQDPYRIWISEIMLQQTQVATVVGYYNRFLERFPDVEALAVAELSEVLEMWSGLGYYRRARSLHQAAVNLVCNHAGRFPRTVEQLQQLDGIGRYTAGAIASFAFDVRAPILEANTIRLHSRLLAIREPVQRSAVQSQLWNFAGQLLPTGSGSGQINQALMELGSLVCTPQNPACHSCPVHKQCQAYRLGIQDTIPLSQPKPATQKLLHVGAIITDGPKLLLRQHGPGEWWSGLWDLPWIELPVQPHLRWNSSTRQQIDRLLVSELDLQCQVEQLVCRIRHAVTKYQIQYYCSTARLLAEPAGLGQQLDWFSWDSLPPVTSRFRKIDWQRAGP